MWLVILGGLVAWAGVQLGNLWGFWEGTFLGAVILTVFAKLSAERFQISSATILLPAIMILVPGYAFLNASYMVNTQEIIVAISAFITVLIIVFTIIIGVFVGDAISRSKKIRKIKKNEPR